MREYTIAAIATAMGEGGIGIIRISGSEALNILNRVFVPAKAGSIVNRRFTYGHIVDKRYVISDANSSAENSKNTASSGKNSLNIACPEEENAEKYQIIDEVMAVYMKAPYTYTKEDVVEINCHGGVVPLKKTLALVLRNGAVLAEPGEFTKRAFLNGRLDLSQAEAVMDLIKAKTDKTFEVALGQLSGELSSKVKELRKELMDLLVEITVNIDYPDEDIEEITYEKLKESLSQIGDKIAKLIASADTGRILREGLAVSIIGKPNVGKSSLMNALLRERRAIVTDIPGTTRDTIEEFLNIKNIPVKLTDTAGIRDTDDKIEKIGIEKSKEAFNKADFVIFMIDASAELSEEDREIIEIIGDRPVLVMLNKNDLGQKITEEEISALIKNAEIISASVEKGQGISELEEKIENLVYGGRIKHEERSIVTNVRHEELLRKSKKSLEDALNLVRQGEALDILEIDVRSAYDFLGEIIGETVGDDIIDEVFSRFCLGK